MSLLRIYAVCLKGLEKDGALRDHLYAAASAERKEKTDRYCQSADGVRCLLAGALLRYACHEAGIDERSVSVATNAYGKPYLRECADFHYNMAHSGDWVVLVWDIRPVGVDVERIDPSRDVLSLAGRYFSSEEQAFVAADATSERFYLLWTAKEAYLKYRGTGFACGAATPDLREEGPVAGTPVCLRRIYLSDGHILAVCGESVMVDVTCISARDLV